MSHKSVDAGITWDPSFRGLASGKVRILANSAQIMPIMDGHYVGNGLYVRDEFMQDHADVCRSW